MLFTILSFQSRYKSILVSERTTVDELIRILLNCYNSCERVEQFSLYEVCEDQEYQRKLHPDDCPLQVQHTWLRDLDFHFRIRRNTHYRRGKVSIYFFSLFISPATKHQIISIVIFSGFLGFCRNSLHQRFFQYKERKLEKRFFLVKYRFRFRFQFRKRFSVSSKSNSAELLFRIRQLLLHLAGLFFGWVNPHRHSSTILCWKNLIISQFFVLVNYLQSDSRMQSFHEDN